MWLHVQFHAASVLTRVTLVAAWAQLYVCQTMAAAKCPAPYLHVLAYCTDQREPQPECRA